MKVTFADTASLPFYLRSVQGHVSCEVTSVLSAQLDACMAACIYGFGFVRYRFLITKDTRDITIFCQLLKSDFAR